MKVIIIQNGSFYILIILLYYLIIITDVLSSILRFEAGRSGANYKTLHTIEYDITTVQCNAKYWYQIILEVPKVKVVIIQNGPFQNKLYYFIEF